MAETEVLELEVDLEDEQTLKMESKPTTGGPTSTSSPSTTKSTNKQKRNLLTIAQKIELLKELDSKTTPKGVIAKKYGLHLKTVTKIIKNRSHIEASFDGGNGGKYFSKKDSNTTGTNSVLNTHSKSTLQDKNTVYLSFVSGQLVNPNLQKKKTRNMTLTYQCKLQMLKDVDEKILTKKQIAKKYKVKPNTLSTIIKKRHRVEAVTKMGSCYEKCVRFKTSNYKEVEYELLDWFKDLKAKSIHISGDMIVKKGEEIAKQHGINNWRPSSGWIDRFKKRHGFSLKRKQIPPASVSAQHVDSTTNGNESMDLGDLFGGQNELTTIDKQNVPEILEDNFEEAEEESEEGFALFGLNKQYRLDDIFCAVDISLFYKCLPNYTLKTNSGDTSDRLTVVAAANSTGNENLPLLVIGKPARFSPKCCNIKTNQPVEYESNSDGKMTSKLFTDWVKKLDQNFRSQRRSVALLVPDSIFHQPERELDCIMLVVLPGDISFLEFSKLFRCEYRKCLLQRYLLHTQLSRDHFDVSVLDALFILRKIWEDIDTSHITANIQTNFNLLDQSEASVNAAFKFEPDKDMTLLFDRVQTLLQTDCTLDGYLTFDSSKCEETVGSCETKDVSTEIQGQNDGKTKSRISSSEAQKALLTVKKFIAEQNHPELFDEISSLELNFEEFISNKSRQTSIKEFFRSGY